MPQIWFNPSKAVACNSILFHLFFLLKLYDTFNQIAWTNQTLGIPFWIYHLLNGERGLSINFIVLFQKLSTKNIFPYKVLKFLTMYNNKTPEIFSIDYCLQNCSIHIQNSQQMASISIQDIYINETLVISMTKLQRTYI